MRAQPIQPIGPLKAVNAKRARTRVRTKSGDMNKTEAAYAIRLEQQRFLGAIKDFWFQAVTLKLGFDTRYTPDFLIQMPDGSLELHDTKGWDTEPAAAVKERVSSSMFPLFVFKEVRQHGGDWKEKIIGAKD